MTVERNASDSGVLSRAQGCLLGQLIGDALGSLVEFQTPERIRRRYPEGVRDMADGGTWNTIAGQPTDDSEMALLLARSLVSQGKFDKAEAEKAYVFWLESNPFDVGNAILSGLTGRPVPGQPGQRGDDADQPVGDIRRQLRVGPGGGMGAAGRRDNPHSLGSARMPTRFSRWRSRTQCAPDVTQMTCIKQIKKLGR